MLVQAVYGSLWADQHTLPTDRTAALLMDLSLLPWNHSTSPSNQPTPSTIIIQPMQPPFQPIKRTAMPKYMHNCSNKASMKIISPFYDYVSARICLIYGLSDLWLYKVLAAPYPSLPPNYRCELLRLSSVIPSQRTVQGARHILDYRSVLYGTAPALAPVLTYRWGHHLPKAEGVKPKIRGNSCLCISNRTLF